MSPRSLHHNIAFDHGRTLQRIARRRNPTQRRFIGSVDDRAPSRPKRHHRTGSRSAASACSVSLQCTRAVRPEPKTSHATPVSLVTSTPGALSARPTRIGAREHVSRTPPADQTSHTRPGRRLFARCVSPSACRRRRCCCCC